MISGPDKTDLFVQKWRREKVSTAKTAGQVASGRKFSPVVVIFRVFGFVLVLLFFLFLFSIFCFVFDCGAALAAI